MLTLRSKVLTMICIGLCGSLFAADAVVEHRREYRKNLADPAKCEETIAAGLKDADPLIRKNALYETYARKGLDALDILKEFAKDESSDVLNMLICCMRDISDTKIRGEIAQIIVDNANDDNVKREAKRFLSVFSRNKKNVRLQDNPAYDHDIVILSSTEIPDNKWLFAKDIIEDGQDRGFYSVKFNDKSWMPIKVGDWESQGAGNYDGVGWYRIRFNAPEKGAAIGAELAFGGVDEEAWVWLNGKYVGQHDMGAVGWDIPFILDITEEIQWGAENVLVVRVYDSAQAGGIWKPIKLNVLK